MYIQTLTYLTYITGNTMEHTLIGHTYLQGAIWSPSSSLSYVECKVNIAFFQQIRWTFAHVHISFRCWPRLYGIIILMLSSCDPHVLNDFTSQVHATSWISTSTRKPSCEPAVYAKFALTSVAVHTICNLLSGSSSTPSSIYIFIEPNNHLIWPIIDL